jgi:hypothetical protein
MCVPLGVTVQATFQMASNSYENFSVLLVCRVGASVHAGFVVAHQGSRVSY